MPPSDLLNLLISVHVCLHCIQSMRVPIKFECFICPESIRNECMPLGKDLLADRYYTRKILGCHERQLDALSVTGKDISFWNGQYVLV